jgi:hypothetical protein
MGMRRVYDGTEAQLLARALADSARHGPTLGGYRRQMSIDPRADVDHAHLKVANERELRDRRGEPTEDYEGAPTEGADLPEPLRVSG